METVTKERTLKFKCFILTCALCIICYLTSYYYVTNDHIRNPLDHNYNEKSVNIERRVLQQLLKELSIAHRYTKSGTVRKHVQNAFNILRPYHLYTGEGEIYASNSTNKTDYEVCPEYWPGKLDRPLYIHGFKTLPCKNKPLDTLITLLFITQDCTLGEYIQNGVRSVYSQIPIIIGTSTDSM